MQYVDMHVDILALFAEAQRFATDMQRLSMSAAEAAYFAAKAAKEEVKRSWHAEHPRREYRTAKQATYELRDIRMRLANGERPKKWGKRWREAAASLGIDIST